MQWAIGHSERNLGERAERLHNEPQDKARTRGNALQKQGLQQLLSRIEKEK
ncbi:unnamed protein product [Heterosigma akashiwo]